MTPNTEPHNQENRKRANRQLLEALVQVWDRVPDQRFGQFVKNLTRDDTGFADPWEWKHGEWFDRLQKASETWATLHTEPHNHGLEGADRIRTGARGLSAPYRYEGRS